MAQFGSSWVLEHHHATRNMRTGSGQSMRDGGGGSTASSSSPGLMADADREKRGSAPGSLPRGLYRLRALARKEKQAWGVRNRGRSARPARWWRWTHGPAAWRLEEASGMRVCARRCQRWCPVARVGPGDQLAAHQRGGRSPPAAYGATRGAERRKGKRKLGMAIP